MMVIARSTHPLPNPASQPADWGQKLDYLIESSFNTLMRWLCRASRGYLCPPDMTSVMYPEDSPAVKSCCDEKFSGQ